MPFWRTYKEDGRYNLVFIAGQAVFKDEPHMKKRLPAFLVPRLLVSWIWLLYLIHRQLMLNLEPECVGLMSPSNSFIISTLPCSCDYRQGEISCLCNSITCAPRASSHPPATMLFVPATTLARYNHSLAFQFTKHTTIGISHRLDNGQGYMNFSPQKWVTDAADKALKSLLP